MRLYKTVEKNDNIIGRRYDMRGLRYFTIVLSLLSDGIIERDELADLDEEARNRILEVYD